MAARLTIVLVVLAAAAAGPARAATNPIAVVSSEQLSPRLTEFMLKTPALNFDAELRVLLPAGYDPRARKRYPVLYLLHGSFDDARSWTNKGAAEELTKGLDLIVVMPPTAGTGDAGGWASDWRNEGNGGPPMWETWGWRVQRGGKEMAFTTLADASRRGFTLRGSGTATVVTPPLYLGRSWHRIFSQGEARRVRAGRGGRLRLTLTLGPERVAIR